MKITQDYTFIPIFAFGKIWLKVRARAGLLIKGRKEMHQFVFRTFTINKETIKTD